MKSESYCSYGIQENIFGYKPLVSIIRFEQSLLILQ